MYPSLYEGFGLPIVEAFSVDKAVIALREAPSRRPRTASRPASTSLMRMRGFASSNAGSSIAKTRAPFEAHIRRSFSHPGWKGAATQFFAAVPA